MESLKRLQISPGKPALVFDPGHGGALLVAMRIALDAANAQTVAHVVFGQSAADAEASYAQIGAAGRIELSTSKPGTLADEGALVSLATGRTLIIVEGVRAGIASADPWATLATLEALSLKTGCAFVCIGSGPLQELRDSFATVIEVLRPTVSPDGTRAYELRQVQKPRGTFESMAPSWLVAEAEGAQITCRLQDDAASAIDREQAAADAELMIAAVLDRPGRVLPQVDGIEHGRCARAVSLLVAQGRVTATPTNFGAVAIHPSTQEFERRALLERTVYESIAANPDICLSSLPHRCQLPATSVNEALARLAGRIRVGSNAGERSFTTEALAVEREQAVMVLQVIKQSRKLTIEAAAEAVGCALRVAEPVFEQQVKLGDLASLGGGFYEWSTAEERSIRKVVLAAKKGIPLHEIAEESGAPEEVIEDLVSILLAEGAIVAELKSGAVYYSRADRRCVA